MHDVDLAIVSSLDLPAVLESLLDKIHRLVPYACGTGIRLLDHKTGLLEPMVCRNMDGAGWREVGRKPGGISSEAVETRAPVLVRNVLTDPRIRDAEFAAQEGLVSCLATPLIVKDEALGVLTFYTREEHEFAGDEIALLTSIARQAAVAIHNSRMYDELKAQKAELETANRELESARRQLEAEVEKRNQVNRVLYRLASIVQQSDDAIMGVTLGGLIANWNRGARKMFGYSAAEVIGRPVFIFLPQEQQAGLRSLFEEFKSGKRIRPYEEVGVTKDGTAIHLSVSFSPVRDTRGKIVGASAIIRDVSERKAQEAERARYASQLQGLAEAAVVVNSSLALDQLLQVVTEKAREIIGAQQSVTSTWNDEKRSLCVHAFSLSEKYAAYRDFTAEPDGSGIYSLVCETNRPMRLTQAELEAHPRFRRFGAYAGRHPPMRGWLCAPLIGRDGQNIGVIQVSDKYEGEFTDDDEAILAQLAQMSSVAIQNARLLAAEAGLRKLAQSEAEEKHKAEQRVAALHEINLAVTSSLDLRSMLDLFMRKIDLLLPYAAAHIRLRDPLGGELQLIADRESNRWKPTEAAGRIFQSVIETRAPVIVKNLLADERVRHREFFQDQGLTSSISVPLISQGEATGALSLFTREQHEFSESEIDFLSTLARNASIAIYHAQLYERIKKQSAELLEANTKLEAAGRELQRRYWEAECLHRNSQEILNSLDLKAILDSILERALAIGSFEVGIIRLWNTERTALEPYVLHGYRHPENVRVHRGAPNQEIQGKFLARVIANHGAVVEENVQTCEGLAAFKAEGAQAAIAVPVIAGSEVLGTLQLGNRVARGFDPNLVRLTEAIGYQIGIAVQKARLHEETRQNLERVKSLHDLNQATSSTLELRSVLDLLLEKLVVIRPYSAGGIRLLNKENCLLEPVACRNLDEAAWKTLGSGHLAGLVFANVEPIVVSNMSADQRMGSRQLRRREGLVSYLGVPLVANGERIGVLSLYTRLEHNFTEAEIAYVSALADQAAISIHNSQLYEEARKLSCDLLASRSQIRTLMSGIVKAKDEEARRIARELHDESGQLLAAVHISLGEMAKSLPAAFGLQVRQTKELLKQVENRLRDLSHELHPSVLDDLGLVAGLEFLAQRLSRRMGIRIPVDVSLDRRLSPLHEITLYRVVQEALNNVARHAQASRARVSLRRFEGAILCCVEDNGVGFDVPPVMERTSVEGLGLLGMRERITALGGVLDIRSAPGKGTKILITLPGED